MAVEVAHAEALTDMTPERSRPQRRRGALALGAAGLLGVLLLSSNGHSGLLAAVHGSPSSEKLALAALEDPRPSNIRLADELQALAPLPAEALAGSPEQRLIAVYHLIATNQLDTALRGADALVASHPNFRLAQLVRADLMSARGGALSGFGTPVTSNLTGVADELAILRDEARLRLQALQERPAPGAVPDEFVSLPATTPYAIAVDTSRARLYLFENRPQGLQLVEDFYVSVGRQGVDKLAEGDQKTPLGVYFITDHLAPRLLQRRFGAGALPLNYPNAYDKLKGRTGSGILLHGVPVTTYSRPPLDSDGCVAMANEDLQRLAARLPQRDTPVVITRQIKWVQAAEAKHSEREAFMHSVQAWQQARMTANAQALQSLYESTPVETADLQVRQRLARPPAAIDNLGVVTWHDDPDKMVVTFKEYGAANGQHEHLLRQYWGRRGDAWRIVAEGQVR
jgi:murein L,D-transpeptidase YafK